MLDKIDKVTNGQSFFLVIQRVPAKKKYCKRRNKINELKEFWTNENKAYRHADSQLAIKTVNNFFKNPNLIERVVSFEELH